MRHFLVNVSIRSQMMISKKTLERRAYWVQEIRTLSGNFGEDSDRLERELSVEIHANGSEGLIDHLRLCGAIPESYAESSTEEKLYSKYTDALLAEAFRFLGLRSLVLAERADAADVDVFAKDYSFVADAKAFRLSRTAKNQKDFKIQAMDGWRRDKAYAMVVCPIYQLPSSSSQVYHQATTRNVCIFTYAHLAMLVKLAEDKGKKAAQKALTAVFTAIPELNPSKEATAYWQAVNRALLASAKEMPELWRLEKIAAAEAITAAKTEALTYLDNLRETIMRMSHKEALTELVRINKIESKVAKINSVRDNRLLDIA